MIDVGDDQVYEKVVRSRDVEHLDCFGELASVFPERSDDFATVMVETDGDDRLEADAQRLGVDIGVIASDDAEVLETTDPRRQCRVGDADGRRDLLVGPSRVLLQKTHDLVIRAVECGERPLAPK